MNQQVTRRISIWLVIGLSLSCLLVIGSLSCDALFFESSGAFCAVEQTSAPTPIISLEETHIAVNHNKDAFIAPVPTAEIFFILLVLLFSDAIGKIYSRRMDETLVRHGPYQKIFLPYLLATHGM